MLRPRERDCAPVVAAAATAATDAVVAAVVATDATDAVVAAVVATVHRMHQPEITERLHPEGSQG